MITLSQDIDLGRDKTRMKDPRDGQRQTATARVLLGRLFNSNDSKRWELQLLADEVGMGKTFVALAVAYSVLEAMEATAPIYGLDGCYQKILIVTPPNGALFNKWNREVSEFVRRCVSGDATPESRERFQPIRADRLDELVAAIRRPGGRGGRVVVTTMNVFGDRKLRHYDLKRRFLLGIVFRHWGQRFNNDARERLLRGAPDRWPTSPYRLTELTDWEASQLPFSEDEALIALERLDRPSRHQEVMDKFLTACRDISEPYRRDRQELFAQVEQYLTKIYRALSEEMLHRSFPLVIVDEAHNWKNGPRKGANGYTNFAALIAARTRRLLLLTATPFQLRPAEMLEILQVSEHLEYAGDSETRARRKNVLVDHSRKVIKPALSNAEQASRRFSKDWSRVPLSTTAIADAWNFPALRAGRTRLLDLIERSNGKETEDLQRIARDAVADLDPEHRPFFCQALFLFALNERLSTALGTLIIRHRRHTEHRLTLVGEEYVFSEKAKARQDRHMLHAAPGLDIRGDGELPHYLLMRCVTAIKQGKGRSSLGSALTGCYSTLLESREGRQLQNKFRDLPESKAYFDTLFHMVREKDDPKHPKLREVVESTVKSWRDGEKTLIFCFRINTAQRLRKIIDDRIRAELQERRKKRLGGEESLRALRGRMTRRDGDLIVLGLDRVLLSLGMTSTAFSRSDLCLHLDDIREISRQALRYGQDLLGERVDRVFLQRTVEYAVARRLGGNAAIELRHILTEMANDRWIEHPYGLEFSSDQDDPASEEVAQVDEKGVHAYYEVKDDRPSTRAVEELTQALIDRRERARRSRSIPILDSYFEAPSLWLGSNPAGAEKLPAALSTLHQHLFDLTFRSKISDWKTRLLLLQALRRAILRESMLLRLLPEKADRDERGWGELLTERFLASLPGQHESMADRMAIFAEDVLSASGLAEDPTSARYNLLDATRLRDQNFVALVLGGGDQRARERIFAGFNTPLLPEVLVCTSVGAEGIDLHRHCRRIVHYDLAWNPAVLEQRTGRVDRIGSKTFREREVAIASEGPSLEVGVPFLAGTYDERMFEELRMRAQTFEVLTGGDITSDGVNDKSDDLSGADGQKYAEGREQNLHLKSLPPEMLHDLRAKLHIWTEAPQDSGTQHESVSLSVMPNRP